jgi:hypothetical protein
MTSSSKKHQRKQEKRTKRKSMQKLAALRMDWSGRLLVETDEASTFFRRKIEKICRELLASPLYSDRHRKQMEELCEVGFLSSVELFQFYRDFSKRLRQKIEERFDPLESRRLDVHVFFGTREKGKAILDIRTIDRLKTGLYASPIRKNFFYKNKSYRLTFNKHAVDRLFERFAVLNGDPLDCARAFDVLYWMKNIYIESDHKDQPMATIWCPLEPFTRVADFYRDLIGVETKFSPGTPEKRYPHFSLGGRELLFRAGYFCLEEGTWEGESILKASTFKLPGMDDTPEHEYFKAINKPDTVTHEKFRSWIDDQNIPTLEQSGDFGFVREVNLAIPQVSVEMEDLLAAFHDQSGKESAQS